MPSEARNLTRDLGTAWAGEDRKRPASGTQWRQTYALSRRSNGLAIVSTIRNSAACRFDGLNKQFIAAALLEIRVPTSANDVPSRPWGGVRGEGVSRRRRSVNAGIKPPQGDSAVRPCEGTDASRLASAHAVSGDNSSLHMSIWIWSSRKRQHCYFLPNCTTG